MRPLRRLEGGQNDAFLIRQILNGRQELLDDLLAPYLSAVSAVVKARMGDDPDVEDVVQASVFKAFTHLQQFRFEASFKTWLIQIAINEVAQNWRKKLPSRTASLDRLALGDQLASDAKDSPFDQYSRNQNARLLHVAVASLPEPYRQVILLREFEEHSIIEVAKALRLTVASVKTRQHRGRRRVAKLLKIEMARRSLGRRMGIEEDHLL
jgi:RNA polymerase sigma-70 factor (ECF subfamily)